LYIYGNQTVKYMDKVQKKSLLTLIELLPKRSKGGHKRGLYRCECGSIKEYFVGNVTRLHTLSCGCRPKDTSSYKKHGLIKHPLYAAWSNIIQRCTNSKDPLFAGYGERGVGICKEWENDFRPFYNWCMENGWKPGLEVDKDEKGGMVYSPENCVILTHKMNSNRRRNNTILHFNGKSQSIAMWAEELGLNAAAISARLNKLKWSVEKALTTPIRGS